MCDLHEPFRAAFDAQLTHATQVADPFHVVALGTRVIDRVRRRVENATLGHRGHRHDPLYRARKLLTMAEERLDEAGHHKLRGLLPAGDPQGEVAAAHATKECLRELYTLCDQPDVAARQLAWHVTSVSNGPPEA